MTGNRRGGASVPPLRITCEIAGYPPVWLSGAPLTFQAICEELVRRGHEVTVVSGMDRSQTGTQNGATVCYALPEDRALRVWLYERSDLVLTTNSVGWDTAQEMARKVGTPLAQHFPNRIPGRYAPRYHPDLAIFCSAYAQQGTHHSWPSIVFHPPVDPERFQVIPGDRVSLVNLAEHKGGRMFQVLANRMPDVGFLGCRGVYGRQVIPSERNVEVVGPVADIREVYARTRVLLVPSERESFGRVALEAAASGIPVLCSDLPGLREAMGERGTYLSPKDPDAWEHAIRRTLRDWKELSERSLRRSREMAPDYDRLEAALVSLTQGERSGRWQRESVSPTPRSEA